MAMDERGQATGLALACGHLYSASLDDGSILTCYGHYISKGGCLIKWTQAPRQV